MSLLLASAAFWQIRVRDLYSFISLSFSPERRHAEFDIFFKYLLNAKAFTVVIYDTFLQTIKLVFLLFLRRLDDQVRRRSTIWWTILAFNVVTFIAWMGYKNWRCFLDFAARRREHALRLRNTNHACLSVAGNRSKTAAFTRKTLGVACSWTMFRMSQVSIAI